MDTIVCMFSKYCKQPFTVEKCEVETPSGEICIYPDIKTRQEKVSVDKVNKVVGIDKPADSIANLLTRMCLSASVEEDKIVVRIFLIIMIHFYLGAVHK